MRLLYRRSPSVVARKIGGEMILVPIRNNAGDLQCIYSLNEAGAFLWERVDGERTVAELLESVRAEFDDLPNEIEGDVTRFLSQLEEIGALVGV